MLSTEHVGNSVAYNRSIVKVAQLHGSLRTLKGADLYPCCVPRPCASPRVCRMLRGSFVAVRPDQNLVLRQVSNVSCRDATIIAYNQGSLRPTSVL